MVSGSGLLGNGIPAFLFAKAQTQLDSALVGTLNAIVPLFTLILKHANLQLIDIYTKKNKKSFIKESSFKNINLIKF